MRRGLREAALFLRTVHVASITQHFLDRRLTSATQEEIYEVFVQAAGYCGFPASNGAVRLYVQVLKEEGLL